MAAREADQLNQALVEQLKAEGYISSPAVEAAFLQTLRHLFAPDGTSLEEAYADKALSVADPSGNVISSLSQPLVVAIMLELLKLEPGQRVLEIGLGSGYNTALMAAMVGETGWVTGIDIEAWLVERAKSNLTKVGLANVTAVFDDGANGYLSNAPYDRIMITAGVWEFPQAWLDQLSPTGRVLLPLNMGGASTLLLRLEKVDNRLEGAVAGMMNFISMRGQTARPEEEKGGPRIVIEPSKGERKTKIFLER